MDSCGPGGFSTCSAILDFRSRSAFVAGHWHDSFPAAWPVLRQLQNALPPPSVPLCLIDPPEAAVVWLREKGYSVRCFTADELNSALAQCPAALRKGWQIPRLWQPSPPLVSFVRQHDPHGAGRRALDLGCGGGRDAVWLAMRGWQVTGVDRSASVLQRARALAALHEVEVNWQQANLRDEAALPSGQWDLMLMMRFVLRDRFDWMARHVRPGGHVIIWAFHPETPHPRHPDKTIAPEEIEAAFAGFRTIVATISPLSDGRPMSLWIGEKHEKHHAGRAL